MRWALLGTPGDLGHLYLLSLLGGLAVFRSQLTPLENSPSLTPGNQALCGVPFETGMDQEGIYCLDRGSASCQCETVRQMGRMDHIL